VRTTADAALAELELELDSSVPAGALRADQQRLVMFAQALSRKAALMIADEPTAGLSSQEAELVVSGLERLKRQGRTLLFVSHRFGEVLRLCDRVTIIRDGATVQTLERSALTREHLIRAVVGEESAAGRDRAAATPDRPVSLRVRDLRGRELRGVTFDAREGEILGVTGLAGSGVEELLAVVGGAETATDGAVALHGDACRFRSPADAIAGGVSYLPADRTRAGLLGMPVRTNVSLARTRATTSSGVLTRASERRATRPVLGRLGLESHADRPLSALSGGNRQRALIARSIFARAGVLLFADPTVGVDFRARAEIHDLLRELADEGRTVVISSSEPEELVALADRVIVLRQGVVKATLEGDGISPESMTAAATY
jgi:ABC-type sugar transport system ATPase subunit